MCTVQNIDRCQLGPEPYSRHFLEIQGAVSAAKEKRTCRTNDVRREGVAAEVREGRNRGGDLREPDRGLRGRRARREIKGTNTTSSHTRLETSRKDNDLHKPHLSTPDREARSGVSKLGGISIECKGNRQIKPAHKPTYSWNDQRTTCKYRIVVESLRRKQK